MDARLRDALDAGYWRGLADGLTVGDVRAAPGALADAEELRERLRADGFATVPDAADPATVATARAAVRAVTAAGWPRVFAWVFDAVWACARAPAVHAALGGVLGAGYRQLPGLWVNEVDARPGARGWGPHTDEPGRARTRADAPARLTAWLALSAATVDNGCMYWVPNRITGDLAERFEALEQVPSEELLRWLRHARPACAEPGTLLVWRTDLFHWGSVATADAREPRLAAAFEAGHEDVPLRADQQPALDPLRPVSFKARLSLIGRGLLAYGKAEEREPFAHAFVPLGEELCDLWLEEA